MPIHISHPEKSSEAGPCLAQEPPSPLALTGAGEDVGVLLVGAQQAHELGGLCVIQWEQAGVILGGQRGFSLTSLSPWGEPGPLPGADDPPWALHSPIAQDYDLCSPRASQPGPTTY